MTCVCVHQAPSTCARCPAVTVSVFWLMLGSGRPSMTKCFAMVAGGASLKFVTC